ncbi:MAG: hypothetical protein GXO31_09265 [Epsilonproteobacteria bacterium]|nr:hypothetical protein [Campylobacterota bacterium]
MKVRNIFKEEVLNKSLRLLQLEKLLIIAKEIEFIENILYYYYGYNDEISNTAKENIKKLLEDINSLKDKIKELEEINDKEVLGINENLNFIIFYDYTRTQIDEMLLVIDALYTKMNQLFGEMLNQYLPYPTFFGRRYSSNGLMMFLDNYYKYLSLKLVSFKKNSIVLGWSYNSGFKYKIFRNRDLKRVNYSHTTYNNYIELPYWYYELPLLIPAITHEVVELSIKSGENFIFYRDYKNFKRIFENFFYDNSNRLVRHIGDVLGYDWIVDELSMDLFSDIVSYEIHGESYIHTLFHNLLGENIAKDFLNIIYEEDGYKIKEYSFKANDWFFSSKRDHNHLRLYFMLYYYQKDKNISKEDSKFLVMKNLLDNIIPLDNSSKSLRGFDYIYKNNFPNFYHTYEVVSIYLKQLFMKLINSNFKIKYEKDDFITKNIDFNVLWDSRFKVLESEEKDIVPYKGEFRRLVHNVTNNLNIQEIGKDIKILILRKIRKDVVNKSILEPDDLMKYMNEMIEDNSNGIDKAWIAYGIYDIAILQSRGDRVDLQKELKRVMDRFRDPKSRSFSLEYFDSKHILMAVTEEIKDKEYMRSYQTGFNLIINIELKKAVCENFRKENIKKMSGYENLKEAIEEIEKILISNRSKFKKAQIFKSLGPKDLTVIIENADVDSLYLLINEIMKASQVNRTFSIFCSDNKDIKIGKEYIFTSYIRVPKGYKNRNRENIEDILKNRFKENIKLYQTTGVMDYKIEWRDLKSTEKLFDNYKVFLRAMTDYQTKIEKEIVC